MLKLLPNTKLIVTIYILIFVKKHKNQKYVSMSRQKLL